MTTSTRVAVLPLVVLAAGLVAACGNAVTTGTSSSSPSGGASATPAASSPAASSTDPLATWCTLRIGESKDAVVAAMGQPNGHKADAYRVQGIDSAEWDVSSTILLASFENGQATNLQAYAGAVGPQGSTEIHCAAFRNTAHPNG